ncbi:MAG: hypothetical protein KJS97_00670 [Alphaproteobacteria bacterium]|nr:hypothetical protein [Alphaproteobacteria bacterium]
MADFGEHQRALTDRAPGTRRDAPLVLDRDPGTGRVDSELLGLTVFDAVDGDARTGADDPFGRQREVPAADEVQRFALGSVIILVSGFDPDAWPGEMLRIGGGGKAAQSRRGCNEGCIFHGLVPGCFRRLRRRVGRPIAATRLRERRRRRWNRVGMALGTAYFAPC